MSGSLRMGLVILSCVGMIEVFAATADRRPIHTYVNDLTPIADPRPLLANHPEYVEPIRETTRFEAPMLVNDADADIAVRAWRFSYNARGIIEMPNHLSAVRTAIVVVHPWGIDDGQGWQTPQPAGVAFLCTPEKNAICNRHIREVVDPFLTEWRPKVGMVVYSLPGSEDAIRRKLYRSVRGKPTREDRQAGTAELAKALSEFDYQGQPIPAAIELGAEHPVGDYFRQFPGLDANDGYNHAGFWKLPTPVSGCIRVHEDDVVAYDAEGYPLLRDFLKAGGIRHVLLTGYNTDMCYASTMAGYENMSRDFNVFLVGDATLATFPANPDPRHATNAAISYAALNQLVTQISWIKAISR